MQTLERLRSVLDTFDLLAVAVSGGVDSLTLAAAAHERLGGRARMFHASSPAVPAEATRRTRSLADARGWALHVIDAGEFADPAYRANPANRCFFCKADLYGTIAGRTTAPIASGTNLDDLGDWRPGLVAARARGVRHPFVEAHIDKATVRRIAGLLALGEIAELPAAPCLSSRIETGIAIDPKELAFVHDAERMVAAELRPQTVRCRVRASGIVIELDPATLTRLDPDARDRLHGRLSELMLGSGLSRPLSFSAYRMGSAFVRASS